MPAGIGDAAHQAVERIDLAHQMALAEPADRRIARHRADGREPLRDKRGARAHARGRGGGLAAGVAAADDDHVETHVDGIVMRISKSAVVLVKAQSPVKIVDCFT